MKSISQPIAQIKCPHCGNKFSPEVALEHDIRSHLDKEYEKKMLEHEKTIEQRVRKMEQEKYVEKMKAIEADREHKKTRLLELEVQAIAFEERELRVNAREQQVDLELRKKILEMEKPLREEAERNAREKAKIEFREREQELTREREEIDLNLRKRVMEEASKVREEERMKAADIQKKLDDQTRLLNEMKRKSDQGSMQAQGEVQELAIEEYLQVAYVRDEIAEVSKGKRGADCIHIVKDGFGTVVGKILYESKRTKAFGGDWTSKLREDMRLTQSDIGVLVTEVLPSDLSRFGLYDGVWVCTFLEFKALSALFRESLIRVGEVKTSQENKGEKMHLLYGYLTSTEFRQKLEAIVEAFQQMQDDLNKEKAQTMSHWAKREKQIFKVIENTVGLYGSIRGIAGSSVKEIEALEMGDLHLLIDR